jgi:uncharacterized protein YndB with AHSA1/START domain
VATVSCHIAATPAQVFSVLANGWYYSDWVVGTSYVRAVDRNWPAAGTRLHHATGVWPLVLRDQTVVEHIEPDRQLILTARGRPLGQARVVLDLAAERHGTRVTLHETPTAGPGLLLKNPLGEAVLARRNTETLGRLSALAEHRTHPED